MIRPATGILRALAILHFTCALALFLAAGWMTFAALSTVPHMVTGTIWTNVPVAVALAFAYSIAPVTLGLRLSVLGRELWWPEPSLRDALVRAHRVCLVIGVIAILVGIQSVEASNRSTARGGGLLSALAWIPLFFGAPMVMLASLSLTAAWLGLSVDDGDPTPGRHAPAESRATRGATPLLFAALLAVLATVGGSLKAVWPTDSSGVVSERAERPSRPRGDPADVKALRTIATQSPQVAAAFLHGAITQGRLGVLRAADEQATLTLLVNNLPTARACLDTLIAERDRVAALIEGQAGPRTAADGRAEGELLFTNDRLSDLESALRAASRARTP